ASQDVEHLPELECTGGHLGHHEPFELELGVGALEVEAGGQFAIGLVDRVTEFVLVHFGNHVETGHGCNLYKEIKPGGPSPPFLHKVYVVLALGGQAGDMMRQDRPFMPPTEYIYVL